MNLILHKPSYPCEPITTNKALSNALGFDEKVLHDIAAKANGMYRRVKPKPGSTRETFDANGLLKDIHQRIKLRILVRRRSTGSRAPVSKPGGFRRWR